MGGQRFLSIVKIFVQVADMNVVHIEHVVRLMILLLPVTTSPVFKRLLDNCLWTAFISTTVFLVFR